MKEGLQRAIEVIQEELEQRDDYIYIDIRYQGLLRAIELIEQELIEQELQKSEE